MVVTQTGRRWRRLVDRQDVGSPLNGKESKPKQQKQKKKKKKETGLVSGTVYYYIY